VFNTRHLKFNITSETDLPDIRKCLNDPFIAEWIYFIPHPYTQENAKAWIERAQNGFKRSEEWLFSARLKKGDAYVGSINLHRREKGVLEMGFWLGKEFRGQGYSAEMAQAALQYAFDVLKAKKVFATTALNNIASQRVLGKCGFVKTGTIESRHGESVRMSFQFEINKED
jgi:ribosomal-protein-alanine N-acetyltransferase